MPSELWGPDVIKYVTDLPTKFLNCHNKFTAEKLNMAFARFALWVYMKPPNSAGLGELERYPLGSEITVNYICYLKHLVSEKAST